MRPLLLALCVPAALSAQNPVPLAAPNGSSPADFTAIAAVAELADGRVVVADRKEHVLRIVDFAKGTMSQLGRTGAGPNEYQQTWGLARGPGDTLWVWDSGNMRLLRVAPSGALAGTVQMEQEAMAGGFGPPRGIDAQGRFYWDQVTRDESMPGFKRGQQQRIVRWKPGMRSNQEVTHFADHAQAMHQHKFFPFAERDAWVLRADGAVGVLDGAKYQLRWVQDGKTLVAGPALPFTRLPVTEADRDAFRDEKALNPAGFSPGSAARVPPTPTESQRAEMRRLFTDEMFPATKPPFEENGAIISPTGEVWVRRTAPVNAVRRPVDVLGADGRIRASYLLPERSRLVAVGTRGLYVVRTDDDGVEQLLRVPLPAR